jgi:hypothetical protein
MQYRMDEVRRCVAGDLSICSLDCAGLWFGQTHIEGAGPSQYQSAERS